MKSEKKKRETATTLEIREIHTESEPQAQSRRGTKNQKKEGHKRGKPSQGKKNDKGLQGAGSGWKKV